MAGDYCGWGLSPSKVFRGHTEPYHGSQPGISPNAVSGWREDAEQGVIPLLSRRGRLLCCEQFAGAGLAGEIPQLPDGLFVAARAYVFEHSERAG